MDDERYIEELEGNVDTLKAKLATVEAEHAECIVAIRDQGTSMANIEAERDAYKARLGLNGWTKVIEQHKRVTELEKQLGKAVELLSEVRELQLFHKPMEAKIDAFLGAQGEGKRGGLLSPNHTDLYTTKSDAQKEAADEQ